MGAPLKRPSAGPALGAAALLNEAVEALPVEFREVFVLREMEGLSYKEIADVARIPIAR